MNKRLEKILVVSADFITINLAFLVYSIIRLHSGWFSISSIPEIIPAMLVVYFYWLILFIFVGMYRTWFASSRLDELSVLFKASFIGVFILFFVIFMSDYSEGNRTAASNRVLIFIYWMTLLVTTGGGRLIIRSIQRGLLLKGIGRRNVIIVGYNPAAHEVHRDLLKYRYYGFDPVCYASMKETNVGKSYKGVKVLGTVKDISRLIDEVQAKEVIIALEKKNNDTIIELISKCEDKNVGLKIVPRLYEILSGQARTSQLYGLTLIDIMPQLMPEWEKKVKRILDIFVALLFILLSLPVTLITAIAIKIDSKGPVFYKQERCGLNGVPFKILKFRSMRKDAEKGSGPVWSQKGDPRITTVGRFIRKVRIDEIPQMFNVLRGEMSLVGPRPERPFFVEKLAAEIPYYRRRLKVRPGITGWAQVKHKYDESIDDVKAKLKYDLFYIENISIRMDFKILFRTVFVVLFGKGHFDK